MDTGGGNALMGSAAQAPAAVQLMGWKDQARDAAQGGASAQATAPSNALAGSGPPDPRAMLAPVLEAATDPATGQLNYNRAFVGLASTPPIAQLARPFLEQAVASGATTVPGALRELETEASRQSLIASAARGLVPLGANVTQTELIRALASPEFARAVPDPRMRAQILASAPRGGAELAQWVAARAQQSSAAVEAMHSVLGTMHAEAAQRALVAHDTASAHAAIDEAASGATGTLPANAPWEDRVASRMIARDPALVEGRSDKKLGVVTRHVEALRKTRATAEEHYNALTGGRGDFAQWWESNLAQQGLV